MTRSANAERPAPRLTIVTVTHGRSALLRRKLDSLEAQADAPPFEWRVGINGRDPASREALEGRAPAFELALSSWPERLPAGQARNRLAAGARAPVLLMSDDDCLLAPGALAARMRAHERHPDAVVVGPLRLPDEMRRGGRREPFERSWAPFGRASWINATGANTSVPTAAFRDVGGYDASFRDYGGEDPDLALRLRERGLRFVFERGALAWHVGRTLGGPDAKPEAAGRAHWRVYRRHRSIEVGLLLGVHPAVLPLKWLLFAGPIARWLDRDTRTYELAYLRGAAAARAAGRGTRAPRAGRGRP